MPKVTNEFIVRLTAVFVGILIGGFIQSYVNFQFDSTVEITDVFSIAVTSYVGFYIASKVQESQSSSRAQKDFFLQEIQSCIKLIDALKEHNSSNLFPFANTKRLFKNLNQHLRLIDNLLVKSKSCKHVKIPKNLYTTLTKVRSTITNKRPNAQNNLTFTPVESAKIEKELKAMRDSLYEILLVVVT